MGFDRGYAGLLAEYFAVTGLSFSVALWWGAHALRAWWAGRFGISHRLMAGFACIALGTSVSRAIRMPEHYYRGLGQYDVAREWAYGWQPVLHGSTALVVVGYFICVMAATMAQRREKRFVWAGCAVYFAVGLLVWWLIGGFGFTYR